MLQKMKKIQVIGPKKDLQNVVDLLYHTGTMHLEDVSKTIIPGDTILRKMEIEKGGEITNLLVKIGGIFLALPKITENKEQQANIFTELQKKNHQDLIARANHVIMEL
jgi:V/A-type H+-transporting ATPase subunit I